MWFNWILNALICWLISTFWMSFLFIHRIWKTKSSVSFPTKTSDRKKIGSVLCVFKDLSNFRNWCQNEHTNHMQIRVIYKWYAQSNESRIVFISITQIIISILWEYSFMKRVVRALIEYVYRFPIAYIAYYSLKLRIISVQFSLSLCKSWD